MFNKLFGKSNKKIKDPSSDMTNMSEEQATEILINRGKINLDSKKYAEALNDYSKAIELDPKNPMAYMGRSAVRRELNDPDGEKDLEIAGQLIRDSENGLRALDEGNELYESEDFKAAIKCYDIAIALLPTITSTYHYRGVCYFYEKEYAKAVQDFDLNILADSSNKDQSYYERSKIKSNELNDEVGALADLNMAIKLNPDDPAFYYSRAILLKAEDAVKDLTKSIELDPSNPDSYFARCLRCLKLEKYEDSISDLAQYISLHDEYCTFSISEALTTRGSLKILQNPNDMAVENAIEDFTSAIQYDSLNEKAYFERGLAFKLLKKHEDAIIDFSKAIRLNPEFGDAYYHRGALRQLNGIDDDGLMDVIKAKTYGFDGYDANSDDLILNTDS